MSHYDRRDKYGLRKGTKRATAAAMFEQGCTKADVRKATRHTQYNLLKKLAGDGHRVVRDGSAIKLEVKTTRPTVQSGDVRPRRSDHVRQDTAPPSGQKERELKFPLNLSTGEEKSSPRNPVK